MPKILEFDENARRSLERGVDDNHTDVLSLPRPGARSRRGASRLKYAREGRIARRE